MAVKIKLLHPRATAEMCGYIPLWLSERNPASAKDQLDKAYVFGGWQPFQGFTLNPDDSLSYPGDPPQRPFAEMRLREERVLMYPGSWVAVIQPDRSFEVARMD